MAVKCVTCGQEVPGFHKPGTYNVKCDNCRSGRSLLKTGTDTDSLIACRECGLLRRVLAQHLGRAHGMTIGDYQSKYPGAPLKVPGALKRSETCKQKQAAAASRRWAKPEERQAQSDRMKEAAPWLGQHLSAEHRAAIGQGGQGKTHNLTAERRQALAELGRLKFAQNFQDPKVRAKLGKATSIRFAKGEKFGFLSPGVHERIQQAKLRNGTLISPGGGRGITGFRKGVPHYCRSTLEANFARILLLENVPYEYEPKVFLLPGLGRWTPDFRLLAPLGNLVSAGWVELKGWRNKDGSLPLGASDKVAAFQRATGEAVQVICQSESLWAQLEAAYKNRILWETPRCNLRTNPELFSGGSR